MSMMSKNLFIVKRTLSSLCKSSKYASAIRSYSVWTDDRTVVSPYKPVEVPNCTLYDYVWQNLEKWPERTLSVCAVTGRGYTYERAFKLSNAFAANLRKKFKLRCGDTTAVMLPNLPDFPIVAMGILEAGGLMTTINPIYTAYEVQRQLVMSNAKVIVTLPEIVKTVKEALTMAKLDIPIVIVKTNGQATPDGVVVFNELSEDVNVDTSILKEVRRTAKDVCFLPYSSGTTGLPKGVELTHRNLVANCEQVNEQMIACHSETTATHQDAVMSILPFFHIYAATMLMFHKMSLGIKLVTLPKFQSEEFLRALEKHKTNVLFAAPPIVLQMASHPAGTPETFRHLEIVINGAAPLSATDVERFFEKTKRKLDFRQGYGLTETSPVVALSPKGFEDHGSVGYAIPNTEIKIVDSDLNTLGPNNTGELLVKGPQVMQGYRDNPEANAAIFTEDGWMRTGDLAFVNDEGAITITDRLKELIKVKGFQVPPAELEGVLREHPAVKDAAIIGVPHPTCGEAPKAFVVLKPNQKLETKHITEFVNERVAPYKRVDDVVFVDSIPKSSAGKILRRILKEKYS